MVSSWGQWPTLQHFLWCGVMLGLAAASRLFLQRSPPTSHLLRMRKNRSWSSELPSNSEGLTHLHHTNTKHEPENFLFIISLNNTQPYAMASDMGLMQEFENSPRHMPQPTTRHSTPFLKPITTSSKMSSSKVATLGHAHNVRLKSSSAPSNPHHCQSYRNPTNPASFVPYIISPHHTNHDIILHPLILLSTLIISPACGELSLLLPSSFPISPQACRHQYVMQPKPTAASQSSPANGQDLWSGSKAKTTLPSIQATILASPQQEGATVFSQTLVPISSGVKVSDLYQNGLMTTSFFGSKRNTSRTTMPIVNDNTSSSPKMEVVNSLAVASGIKATPWKMDVRRSLMRTTVPHSEILSQHTQCT